MLTRSPGRFGSTRRMGWRVARTHVREPTSTFAQSRRQGRAAFAASTSHRVPPEPMGGDPLVLVLTAKRSAAHTQIEGNTPQRARSNVSNPPRTWRSLLSAAGRRAVQSPAGAVIQGDLPHLLDGSLDVHGALTHVFAIGPGGLAVTAASMLVPVVQYALHRIRARRSVGVVTPPPVSESAAPAVAEAEVA